MKKLKYRACA